jgi:hypothetical protein
MMDSTRSANTSPVREHSEAVDGLACAQTPMATLWYACWRTWPLLLPREPRYVRVSRRGVLRRLAQRARWREPRTATLEVADVSTSSSRRPSSNAPIALACHCCAPMICAVLPPTPRSRRLRIGARYRALNVIKGDSAERNRRAERERSAAKSRERTFAAFDGESESDARWWAKLRGRCYFVRQSNGLTRDLRA